MAKTTTADFREHLSTVDKKGKRVWLYPKVVKGNFYKWRTLTSWVLLSILFVLPWLHFKGHPLFLFNIIERKFILFGIPFWPQDLHIIAIGLIAFMVFIIAFTAVFGRFFCGWICPQTIFMEMVFRKIEFAIEGSPKRQKKLNEQEWNWEKIWKKSLKNTVFWIISFAIANTFLAYIVGSEELVKTATDPVGKHIGGFLTLILFTTIFYFVFARVRELVCVMICPYGRLQGVLLDPNSIVVAYDYNRGEPRGKLQKNATTQTGDCVDCGICVDVCPTGIDIRNGTQLECTHCTACIDACNEVMAKIKKPEGLIRHASQMELKIGKKGFWTNRVKAYTAMWVVLFGVFVSLVLARKDLQVSIFRATGSTYLMNKDSSISNLYTIKMVNKTFHRIQITVRSSNQDQELIILSDSLWVEPGHLRSLPVVVKMSKKAIKENTLPVQIDVYSDKELIGKAQNTFLAPVYN